MLKERANGIWTTSIVQWRNSADSAAPRMRRVLTKRLQLNKKQLSCCSSHTGWEREGSMRLQGERERERERGREREERRPCEKQIHQKTNYTCSTHHCNPFPDSTTDDATEPENRLRLHVYQTVSCPTLLHMQVLFIKGRDHKARKRGTSISLTTLPLKLTESWEPLWGWQQELVWLWQMCF